MVLVLVDLPDTEPYFQSQISYFARNGTYAIEKLERLKLLSRQLHGADRREKIIELTDLGRAFKARLIDVLAQISE